MLGLPPRQPNNVRKTPKPHGGSLRIGCFAVIDKNNGALGVAGSNVLATSPDTSADTSTDNTRATADTSADNTRAAADTSVIGIRVTGTSADGTSAVGRHWRRGHGHRGDPLEAVRQSRKGLDGQTQAIRRAPKSPRHSPCRPDVH